MAPEVEVAREMGYSNESNPFGDSNLQDKFVWKAKHQKLRESGIDPDRRERELAHQRRFVLKDEVGKVKARRDEREEEKELWEREQRRMQLEREMGTLEEWQKQEEKFHAEQAKQRATIRLKEGRAKPIDRIYKNLTVLDDVNFDIQEPHLVLKNMSLDELKDFSRDVDAYIGISEDNREHLRFWRALKIVSEDAIQSAS